MPIKRETQSEGKAILIMNPDTKEPVCVKRLSMVGSNNHNWKGDNVGIDGIHAYIRRHKTQPEFCEKCNQKPSYDLANISGKYLRDLNDWQYLCRSCHMNNDGRIVKLLESAQKSNIGRPSRNRGKSGCFSEETIKKLIDFQKTRVLNAKRDPKTGRFVH